jgi:hypothetical protein
MERNAKEKTEYVGLYVTKELAKELNEIKNTERMKETLIKQYVTNEKLWLEEEIKSMDEITIKYTAKLLTIKDKFSEAMIEYTNGLEKLMNIVDNKE